MSISVITEELIKKYQINIDSMELEGFFPKTIYSFDSDILNIHWINYGYDFYNQAMKDLLRIINEYEKVKIS